jgi:ketosteroid isomerase-like protein
VVAGETAGPGGRVGAAPPEQAQANDRPTTAAAAPAASDNTAAIQQLLAGYASAMESLDPAAVAAVYPGVDTRALGAAFRQYNSLDEEITINRIDVAADGQSATVNAVLAINQVVKIGRAAPVTRNVVFALRRQGDRWVIESIK